MANLKNKSKMSKHDKYIITAKPKSSIDKFTIK